MEAQFPPQKCLSLTFTESLRFLPLSLVKFLVVKREVPQNQGSRCVLSFAWLLIHYKCRIKMQPTMTTTHASISWHLINVCGCSIVFRCVDAQLELIAELYSLLMSKGWLRDDIRGFWLTLNNRSKAIQVPEDTCFVQSIGSNEGKKKQRD